jgi:galactonate dehydratase
LRRIWRTRADRPYAQEENVAVAPHNPSGPVAHAHTLHACLALRLDQPVEYQFAESLLFELLIVGNGPTSAQMLAARHPLAPVPLSLADPSFA